MEVMEMVGVRPVVVGIKVVEVVGVDMGVVGVDRVVVVEIELLGTRRSVDRGGSCSSPCGMGVVGSSSRKGQRSHVAYSRRGHQGGIQKTLCHLSTVLSPVTRHVLPPCDQALKILSYPPLLKTRKLQETLGQADVRYPLLRISDRFDAPRAAGCGPKSASNTWHLQFHINICNV